MKNSIKNLCIICSFLFLHFQSATAQEYIDWSYLADVEFKIEFNEELGYDLYYANFGKMVSPYEGKEVIIQGYMIPLDPMGVSYVLSKNPNSSCFFCGGAGPETVLELQLKPSAMARYEVDAVKSMKGILKLNKVNKTELTFVLTDAEPFN